MRSSTSPPPALQRARPGDHARAIYSAEKMSGTSVTIIKNEVGCRDDTVPKTVETRRHCEED